MSRLYVPDIRITATHETDPAGRRRPPDGFCKLIVDRGRHIVLGAHVIGEYSAEIVQMVAACMVANMHVEQIAELQLVYPTFTEAVSMAAQKVCRRLGIGRLPQVWSYLGSDD